MAPAAPPLQTGWKAGIDEEPPTPSLVSPSGSANWSSCETQASSDVGAAETGSTTSWSSGELLDLVEPSEGIAVCVRHTFIHAQVHDLDVASLTARRARSAPACATSLVSSACGGASGSAAASPERRARRGQRSESLEACSPFFPRTPHWEDAEPLVRPPLVAMRRLALSFEPPSSCAAQCGQDAAAQITPPGALPPPSSSGEVPLFEIGAEVEIDGLAKLRDFNGLSGVIQAWDIETYRYDVLLDATAGAHAGRHVKVKAGNLLPRLPPPPGSPPSVGLDAAQTASLLAGCGEDYSCMIPHEFWPSLETPMAFVCGTGRLLSTAAQPPTQPPAQPPSLPPALALGSEAWQAPPAPVSEADVVCALPPMA